MVGEMKEGSKAAVARVSQIEEVCVRAKKLTTFEGCCCDEAKRCWSSALDARILDDGLTCRTAVGKILGFIFKAIYNCTFWLAAYIPLLAIVNREVCMR